MRMFTVITGPAAPLLQPNIDTDLIIRIERLTSADQNQLGKYALEALRYLPSGEENPDFILNQRRFRQAPILIAGENFGCGSSREGAVSALSQMGIRVILAPSFGDIFFSNCFQNGLLPVRLSETEIDAIVNEVMLDKSPVTVDLTQNTIKTPSGRLLTFEVDAAQRTALLAGLDEIEQTALHRQEILAWQSSDRAKRPWVWTNV